MKPTVTRTFRIFFVCMFCSACLSCGRGNESARQPLDGNGQSLRSQEQNSGSELLDALRFTGTREPKGPDGPKLGSAGAYINLSLEYYKEGSWASCIDASIEALVLDPDSVSAYNNICVAYIQIKDYDRAILACTKAIALDPGYQLAKNNLNWARESKAKDGF